MAIKIRRREFISVLGGAALAWPLAALAQQSEKLRLVSVLIGAASNDPEVQNRLAAFRNAIQAFDRTEGRKTRMEIRWMGDSLDGGKAYAAELIALAPDVILAAPTTALVEMSRLTRTIPIVFANVSDPVGSGGFVSSLEHPGGNITGFSNFEPTMGGKWLQVLKEIAPAVGHATALVDRQRTIQTIRMVLQLVLQRHTEILN